MLEAIGCIAMMIVAVIVVGTGGDKPYRKVIVVTCLGISFTCLDVVSFNKGYAKRQNEVTTARSPASILVGTTKGKEPGSGHAFGKSIVYTIERHTMYDNMEVAICASGEKGVEILSSIPELVSLPDKSQFILTGPGDWNDVFRVVKRGDK